MNFSKSIAPMNYFERLPEGCIFEIITKTTPADAVRSTILSKQFNVVAKSDDLWGKFLPSNYQELIDRSEIPPVCNTKKELFFSLCDSPILLDGGKLSFFLDKHSGKKCFMIAPRELIISGNYIRLWQWKKHPNSRFSEVAYLGFPYWLDICGRIGTNVLSPNTYYIAYLVFKVVDLYHRLESINSPIMLVSDKNEIVTEEKTNTVRLAALFPKLRGDGWMEIELGNFNSKESSDGPIVESMIGIKRLDFKISGLIIEGIEFRPRTIE